MSKNKFLLNVASERIERLFELATKAQARGDKKLTGRYVKIARSISKHYKIGIPNRLKRTVCKKCGEIQIPGLNSKVTIASSKNCIIYRCKCGAENKMFFKKPI